MMVRAIETHGYWPSLLQPGLCKRVPNGVFLIEADGKEYLHVLGHPLWFEWVSNMHFQCGSLTLNTHYYFIFILMTVEQLVCVVTR